MGECEPFKTNPPFVFGPRQMANALLTIGPSVAAAFWPLSPAVSAAELAAPTTTAGLRAYYAAPNPAPAIFRFYRPGRMAYKELIAALDVWKARAGWSGYFNLLNYVPHVTCSVVPSARDLTSIEARMAGAFVPVGLPPTGRAWKMMNSLHVRLLFMNNYGRHDIHTTAKPRAFIWDWVGMAGVRKRGEEAAGRVLSPNALRPQPIAGCGCITINGEFMAWTRWTRAGLDTADDILAPVLGERIGELDQMAALL